MAPEQFLNALDSAGVKFYTGVPDSLLKGFCYLLTRLDSSRHISATNEGMAVSLAIGHYLGSRSTPAVYLQNSGLGNALNPVISLAHKSVYQIPLLLIIGWRGEPGSIDEPQHQAQGSITIPILEICGIQHMVLSENTNEKEIKNFVKKLAMAESGPFAIVVSKSGLSSGPKWENSYSDTQLTRKSAIQTIVKQVSKKDIIVATTGKISRELLAARKLTSNSHADFLCVGGMGHASSISTGIAISNPSRRVFCLDGDGALQMHLGSAATIGELAPKNLFHVVFNNGSHDSVGGQPVAAPNLDYQNMFRAFGYLHQLFASSEDETHQAISFCNQNKGPIFIEIKIIGGRDDQLPRPTEAPVIALKKFQKCIQDE